MGMVMRYVLGGLVLVVGAAGCVRRPIEGRAEPYLPKQIHFAAADLANRTAVGTPIMDRKDGLLHVTVPIRAASMRDLHVDYRVRFLDDRGAPIYESGWTGGTVLESNTWSYVHANSPTADAADFQMDFRYAQ
jgi:hypothetical protein